MARLSAVLRSVMTNIGAGIAFWCPGCNHAHAVATDHWTWNGDVDNPTISPSILVTGGGVNSRTTCHSFVVGGNIQFLDDCTHALKGQRVPLPPFPGNEDDR